MVPGLHGRLVVWGCSIRVVKWKGSGIMIIQRTNQLVTVIPSSALVVRVTAEVLSLGKGVSVSPV